MLNKLECGTKELIGTRNKSNSRLISKECLNVKTVEVTKLVLFRFRLREQMSQ
jgi:hypothetical protein